MMKIHFGLEFKLIITKIIVKYPMNVLQTDTKYTIEIINIKPVVIIGSFSTRTKNARGEEGRNPGKLEKFIDY